MRGGYRSGKSFPGGLPRHSERTADCTPANIPLPQGVDLHLQHNARRLDRRHSRLQRTEQLIPPHRERDHS